ncbi:MAG: AsnC family transcriptional regulator, partial [Acetobacterium sp.]|nr:AsnC family transcriptional regulator [Acetobacterium sp.]
MDNQTKALSYLLGTSEQQSWLKDYYFAPKGLAFLEPGVVPADDVRMSAFNVAKSSYQIRPDVFNMAYLTQAVGLDKEEIIQRIKRLYEQKLIVFVKNTALSLYGFGLYFWVVKLHEDAPAQAKAELSQWFQNKDDICTGFECNGDFDFYNGNHMRVLDNLLADVIEPWKNRPEVKYVHLCPIRRILRESHANMWDSPGDTFREVVWGPGQVEKLTSIQTKMDLLDFKILQALNNKRPMEDYFDYKVLS